MNKTFNTFKVKLLSSFLASICLIAPNNTFALEEYFDAKVDLALCPEYKLGGVVIDLLYKIGDSTIYNAPQILSSSTDTKTYSATIRLPSFYGTTPLKIVSFCRSGRGFSKESNSVSITNCDNLAQYDTDKDGIPNNQEDTNCDNFYSPGDRSNPDNVDTDGDGVRDLVENVSGTDPSNPGSSPRPYIYSSSSFDPDQDGVSNPVVWRPSTGNWYIKAAEGSNDHQSIAFGAAGDLPFTYSDRNKISNIGFIRRSGTQLFWNFRGTGFTDNKGIDRNLLQFGIFGDNIILGPWEKVGVTNPAVARLFNGVWTFDILKSDLTIKSITFGSNGDIPKVEDFDGDGLFDIAVYRPGTQTTYIIYSTDNSKISIRFGSGTADHTVKGDFTGDGKDEISFWEPISGKFTSLTSNSGYDDVKGSSQDPNFYRELNLGEYVKDLPLNWNTDQDGLNLYTIINHGTGIRKFYPKNNTSNPMKSIQWGINGDSQG